MKQLLKRLLFTSEPIKEDIIVSIEEPFDEQSIIKQIHDDFDSAQDRLLSQANELLQNLNIPTESEIEKKAERLKNIGFVSVPTVKKAEMLITERKINESILVETKEQADIINNYKLNYPFLKFLTESELDRICKKYGLIHAPVKNFIKEVPDKNLKEIENAQTLKNEDRHEKVKVFEAIEFWTDTPREIIDILSRKHKIITNQDDVTEKDAHNILDAIGYTGTRPKWLFRNATLTTLERRGLFICAPPTDFDLSGLTQTSELGWLQTTTIIVDDPIVFRYCRGGVQVLSKWGLEANDQDLILPINN